MENGLETKYTFELTRQEACLIAMALCEFTTPAENFLNDLNDKKCPTATIMAHVEGDLERAVRTIEDANKLLLGFASVIPAHEDKNELIEECSHTSEITKSWRSMMKKLDENVRVSRI